MNFISLRRKYLRLVVFSFFLLVLLSTVIATWKLSNYDIASLNLDDDNVFGKLYGKFIKSKVDGKTSISDSEFNEKVDKILHKKMNADAEDKFWIMKYDLTKQLTLTVPDYYFEYSQEPVPDIQPFDPRFTLSIYINHIKQKLDEDQNKRIEIPFHWGDWADLSHLKQYLLAPDSEKPDCSLLDARDDEDRLTKQKEEKEKLDALELAEYAKSKGTPLPEEEEKEEEKKQRMGKRHAADEPDKFCLNNDQLPADHADGNSVHPGFNVFKAPGKVTEELGIIIGKSYLYSFAPAPDSIIFLTRDGSYNVTVSNKKSGLLTNDLVRDYVKHSGKRSIDLYDEFHSLQAAHASNKHHVINDYEVSLSPEDFKVDFNEIINHYEDKIRTGSKLADNEIKYYRSLQYSKNRVENGGPPKYFYESRLLHSTIGDHYDWRFFNGIQYETYEQTLTLHHLVRTFLNFCRKSGVNVWVAHGSLLSWYWNGIAFPWDNDIDVQMPINDLHKLSRDFNQTLIVEDLDDGLGRYLIDCGTFITLRAKGNGLNNIDARFIDVDTGLYIDITGLALSNSSPPNRYKSKLPKNWQVDETNYEATNEILQVYNCRNNHFSNFNEINPLVKSNIEGEIGYIPKKFNDVLAAEYSKGTLSKKFSHHVFLQQLRLWVREEDLYYFLNDKEKWNKYHNFQEYYVKNGINEEVTEYNYELTEEEKKKLKLEAKLREKNGEKLDDSKYGTKLNDDEMSLVLNLSKEELLELLNKDEILMEYISTRDFTSFHEQEMLRLLINKSTRELSGIHQPFNPIKIDPFYFKVLTDYIDYDKEVENYLNLNKIYKASKDPVS